VTTKTTGLPATSTTGPSLARVLDDGEKVTIAKGITLQRRLGQLSLTRSLWRRSPGIVLLIPFTIFWDAVFFAMASTGQLPLLFYFTHGLPAVFLPYFILVSFISKQRITVARGHVEVRTGPLPWFGNRILPRHKVRGIDVAPSKRSDDDHALTDIVIRLDDGSTETLVTVEDEAAARTLADALIEEFKG